MPELILIFYSIYEKIISIIWCLTTALSKLSNSFNIYYTVL